MSSARSAVAAAKGAIGHETGSVPAAALCSKCWLVSASRSRPASAGLPQQGGLRWPGR